MLNAAVQAHQLLFFRNILSQPALFPLSEGGVHASLVLPEAALASAPLSAVLGDVTLGLTYVVVEAKKAWLVLLSPL